jgi:3-phenylpropionate/cinnamic acid dioxygenase small subunit
MSVDPLQALTDERDIERALIRVARAMDDRDWSGLADILADDAVGDFGTGRVQGRAAIIELIRGFLDSCGPTQHLLGNILVDVAEDMAVSRAYVHDVHLGTADPSSRFYTLGDYRDTWERRAGVWRLVERTKANRAHVGFPEEVFSA